MSNDFNDSFLFTLVVREGGFAGAARILGLPPSSVSRRITRLEERVGARLLVRTTRHSTLTDAVRAYFERIAPAFDEISAADAAVGDMTKVPRGSVRVTVPEDLRGIGAIWVGFSLAHPDVDLHVCVTNRYVDLVGESIDVALRAGKPEQVDLVARRVASYTILLVASAQYLDSTTPIRTRADLANHAVVFVHIKSSENRWIRPTRKLFGVPVRARLVVEDLASVHAAVRAGIGIAALPEHVVAEDLERGTLRQLTDASLRIEAPLYLVMPNGTWRPRAVQAFIEYVAKELPLLLHAMGSRQNARA